MLIISGFNLCVIGVYNNKIYRDGLGSIGASVLENNRYKHFSIDLP